ncbi:MAG: hypothetical protein ACTSVE_01805 [Candidatus Helarchaeota archaeon]
MAEFISKIFKMDEFSNANFFSYFAIISIIILNIDISLGIFILPFFPNLFFAQLYYLIPMTVVLLFAGSFVDKIPNKSPLIGFLTAIQGIFLLIIGLIWQAVIGVAILFIIFSILTAFNLILSCAHISEQDTLEKKHINLSIFLMFGLIFLTIPIFFLAIFTNTVAVYTFILGIISIVIGFSLFFKIYVDDIYISGEKASDYDLKFKDILLNLFEIISERNVLINIIPFPIIFFIIGIWNQNILLFSTIVIPVMALVMFFLGYYLDSMEFENTLIFILVFLFIGIILSSFNLLFGYVMLGVCFGIVIYYLFLTVPNIGFKNEQGRYFSIFLSVSFLGYLLGVVFGSFNVIINVTLSVIFFILLIVSIIYFYNDIQKLNF